MGYPIKVIMNNKIKDALENPDEPVDSKKPSGRRSKNKSSGRNKRIK